MTIDPNKPAPPNLCDAHHIPLGLDGRCIQCQRELELGQMAQSRSGYQAFVSVISVLLVLGGCAAAGYFFLWPWYQRWEKEQADSLVMEGPWEGPEASDGDDAGTRKSRWSRPTYRKRQRKEPVRRSSKATVHATKRQRRQIRNSIRSPFNKPTVKIIKPGADRVSGVAAASRRVNVVVYVTSWCPACRKARRWLKRKNIRHSVLDVQRNRTAMMELRSLNPRGSIPTFKIGRQVLVGFSSAGVTRAIYRAAR